MRDAYLGMPVVSTFFLIMGVGYIIGGIRSCLIVGGLILFIALSEYWNRALITAYMATFAVGVSAILGIVTGSLCARNEISAKFILGVCDFFQTFPSFVYLIPCHVIEDLLCRRNLFAPIASAYTILLKLQMPQAQKYILLEVSLPIFAYLLKLEQMVL